LRWASYIFAPFFAGTVIFGFFVAAVGLGAGGGVTVPLFVLVALVFYLAFALAGAILGALIGLIGGLIGFGRPRTLTTPATDVQSRSAVVATDIRENGAPPPQPRPSFLRRRWRWIAAGSVLLILALGFVMGVDLRTRIDRRLARAIAAADRDDPYWRLDDLIARREPVPDSENSALVLARVLAILPRNWPGSSRGVYDRPAPPPTGAAKALNELNAVPDNQRLDEESTEALRSEIQKYSESVQIARTVAGFARGRHELKLKPALIDTLLAETEDARAVARLLAADAAVRAEDGDLDGALDTCRAIIGVSRSIGDEPFLISQLVRISIGESALQSTLRVLAQGEPFDQALARLQEDVSLEISQSRLLYGLKAERAINNEIIRRIRDREVDIAALGNAAVLVDAEESRPVVTSWGKVIFDEERAMLLEWLNQAVAIARLPAAERPSRWRAWDADVFVRREQLGSTAISLAQALLHPLSSPAANDAHFDSALRATATLLAAERHRRKSGTWPASVSAIDRQILPNAPVDGFSGQAFRLLHHDGKLLVYSIGPNGKDEHGAFDRNTFDKGGPDDFGTSAWDASLRRQPAQRIGQTAE
jgi:hypothetical protein